MTRPLSTLLLVSTLALSVLGSGCSPVDDQADAGLGLRAMLGAVGPVGIYPLPQAWGGPSNPRTAGLVVGEEIEYSCPEDGKLRFSGSSQRDPEIGHFYGLNEFDLGVRFWRCEVEGIRLGGEIDYSFTMEAGPSNWEPSLEWSYVGELELRGDAQGRCEIDLVATGEHTDAFGHAEARVFTGTVCGFDVEDVAGFVDFETVF